MMKPPFQSDHFTLHPLTEGVYAAIATELGAGFSNAGIIDLGDRTLVFDAFENPQAAEDLLSAGLQLTRRKPSVVIISHLHPDHWGGLQVFKDSAILATHVMRQAMVPIAEEMSAMQADPSDMEDYLHELEATLAAQTDPLKRKSIEITLARQRYSIQALPTLEPTLPNQTFKGKIVFHGTQRSAELIDTGKGHTKSDCLLRLSQDSIAFIGDIGFFQGQPFMAYGFPSKWLALLEELLAWDIETFVPGHGQVGSKDDLELEARYIRLLEDMVHRVVQAGGTVEDALQETLPPPFDAWQVIGQSFEYNVRASFKRHSRQKDNRNDG